MSPALPPGQKETNRVQNGPGAAEIWLRTPADHPLTTCWPHAQKWLLHSHPVRRRPTASKTDQGQPRYGRWPPADHLLTTRTRTPCSATRPGHPPGQNETTRVRNGQGTAEISAHKPPMSQCHYQCHSNSNRPMGSEGPASWPCELWTAQNRFQSTKKKNRNQKKKKLQPKKKKTQAKKKKSRPKEKTTRDQKKKSQKKKDTFNQNMKILQITCIA